MDFIIVLHGSRAVKAFSSNMHVSVGAGLSAAAGPVGRVFEADVRAGSKGSGMSYTYSCSKGSNSSILHKTCTKSLIVSLVSKVCSKSLTSYRLFKL